MSGSAQTPASRRFLVSQSRPEPGPQTQSAPSRRSQFLRSSHATSSSPYAVSPLARHPPVKDDIETSFDIDNEAEDEDIISYHQSTPVKRNERDLQASDWIEDEAALDSLSTQSRFPGRESRNLLQQLSPTTYTTDDRLAEASPRFSSPLPKRQKLTHRVEANPDPILISSSPSPSIVSPDFEDDGDVGLQQPYVQLIDEDGKGNGGSNDAVGEPRPTSTSTTAKFLAPTVARFPLAENHVRPGFRAFHPNMASGSTAYPENVLPDAFSPSKRRSKREYIRGGAAETVRSWILHMANGELQNTAQAETFISVKPVSRDPSGRFELAADGDGRSWMLICPDDRPSHSSLSQLTDADGLVKVALKGAATTWAIEGGAGLPLHVAVLWDVVK